MQPTAMTAAQPSYAPVEAGREITPLLKDGIPALLHILADSYLYISALISISTGARLGETLGLRWEDVELKKQVIFIKNQLQQIKRPDGSGYDLVLRKVKSKKSERRLDIPEVLVNELQKHHLKQKKERLVAGETWQDNNLVCCLQDGRPIRPSSLSSRF
jgi:integrase